MPLQLKMFIVIVNCNDFDASITILLPVGKNVASVNRMNRGTVCQTGEEK